MVFKAKGAEANLYIVDGCLVKERIEKKYRIKEIDERLRRLRTQREAKLLDNALRAGIMVPKVKKIDSRTSSIFMEYVGGVPMKDYLESADEKEVDRISKLIGESISRMHEVNIVHNDLTTSNMLVKDKLVYFIDFGLGTTSTRIEDKAMDLVVLKKSLGVSHTEKAEQIWHGIVEAYKHAKSARDILSRVGVIERRVRYSSE